MPQLVVMRDWVEGGREYLDLTLGANLAAELRRLFPKGFTGRWYLYRTEISDDTELDYKIHESLTVEEGRYLLIVRPAGPLAGIHYEYLIASFVVSFAIGAATKFFTPGPRTAESTSAERKESGNNQLAAQTNLLRPGARVPDILGKVRAYPDLLSYVIESWNRRTQQLQQFFVLGRGDYDVSAPRLGETLLSNIGGATLAQYAPGSVVPQLPVLKTSVEVNEMSLMSDSGVGIAPGSVTFAVGSGPSYTMSLPISLSVAAGDLVAVHNTTLNNGFYKVVAIPSSGPPYVYTMEGPFVAEVAPSAIFDTYVSPFVTTKTVTASVDLVRDSAAGGTPGTGFGADNGYVVIIGTAGTSGYVRGIVRNLADVTLGPPGISQFNLEQIDGSFYTWGAPTSYGVTNITRWIPSAIGFTSGTGATTITPASTGWYRVPLDDYDEVWVDVDFPQGLVKYAAGAVAAMSVQVRIEFRRPGDATVVHVDKTYTDSASGQERYTETFTVAALTALGLPSGVGCEVRLTRLTVVTIQDSTNQFIDETRWARLAAFKNLPAAIYPDVTLLQLAMTNSRAAVSLGETAFNCVATRILPTWTGSAWSAPAPTEKWADNLVARMKADDGAYKTDAEIDLDGIYAVQAALDAMDGGAQGKISVTLDQLQDIDAELQTIALTVRCQVYRIGRKLFVTRDEGGKTALALFTGRSKSADGEQVQLAMKNDSEPDAVIVAWVDQSKGFKVREYQYPEGVTPINVLRTTPPLANWAQAWRRAQYEWNRITYRRDTLTMDATEEARLLHIGDVVNVTDDCANLAQSAGELIAVAGTTLTLDRPIDVSAGGFTILLRAQDGRTITTIPVTQGAVLTEVVLGSAPAFAIKGRDDALGTIYAIYQTAAAVIRAWLVTNLSPQQNYTRLIAMNWREEVFSGDTASLPAPPALLIERVRFNDDGSTASV